MNQLTNWRTEKTKYLASQNLRSVHHASVMVPSINGTRSEISFLNHFLLKRNYRDVVCRLTAIDANGDRLESMAFNIDDPRAYTFDLHETFAEHGGEEATTFIVDFFCNKNLYYSLPAVMVNHRAEGCVSTVHAHLRVLNDVFEDDWVRNNPPIESSIDVVRNAEVETFFAITAGTQEFKGVIPVELVTQGKQSHKTEIGVDISRFQTREITISEMFPETGDLDGGILRITRPHQFLLYGRLMSGKRHAAGGVSANHSFYDYSSVVDYFDKPAPWEQTYPYWHDFGQRVRVYSTQSPSKMVLSLSFKDAAGRELGSAEIGELISPSDSYFDVDITEKVESAGLSRQQVASFVLSAIAMDDRLPTRFNHQLVFADPNRANRLPASINFAMQNANRATSKSVGSVWGQMVVGGDVETRVGFTTKPQGQDSDIAFEFYDATGLIASQDVKLPAGGCFRLDATEMFENWIADGRKKGGEYIWYLAKGGDPSLCGFSIARNKDTGHVSAEHNF